MSRASWPLVVVPYSLRIRPPRRSHLGRRRQRPGGLPPVTRGRGGGTSAALSLPSCCPFPALLLSSRCALAAVLTLRSCGPLAALLLPSR